jgi:Uncharacterized protein, similar to the N-terminal domain of Lon protease
MTKDTKSIPIFPLGGALLLPQGNLPLNIFEPRYIDMVDHAMKSNKIIGMIQPMEKNKNKYYKIGCAGKITNYNEVENNRYLINLKGISKFQILDEIETAHKFKLFNVELEKNNENFNEFNEKLFNKKTFLDKIREYLSVSGLNLNWDSVGKIDEASLIIMIAMVCPFSTMKNKCYWDQKI